MSHFMWIVKYFVYLGKITNIFYHLDTITINNMRYGLLTIGLLTTIQTIGFICYLCISKPTTGTLVSTSLSGSFVITVTNLVLGGPSAVFNVTNNGSGNCGQVMRTVAAPGNDKATTLDIKWPGNTGILLNKTKLNYDGSYRIKIM